MSIPSHVPSKSKKFCEQCPICAKQNIASHLRQFQVHLNDYVTLCDNEMCLYPMFVDSSTSSSLDRCSSPQSIDASPLLESEVPDFFAALENFSIETDSESVALVTPDSNVGSIDAHPTSYKNNDDIDSLIALLCGSISEVSSEPTSNFRDLLEGDDSSSTIPDLDSRATTPEPALRDFPAKKRTKIVQHTSEKLSSSLSDPVMKTSYSTESDHRRPGDICKSLSPIKQRRRYTKQATSMKKSPNSSDVSKLMSKNVSVIKRTARINRKKVGRETRIDSLDFMNFFPKKSGSSHSSSIKKVQSTNDVSSCSLLKPNSDINKKKMVTCWLSKVIPGAAKAKSFNGYQSFTTRNQKDEGPSSIDSGFQSPMSPRSAASESTPR